MHFIKSIFCKYLVSALLFSLPFDTAFASSSFDNIFPKKTVYFGVNMGGGSTEWKYLVDTTDPLNDGVNPSFSTPTAVTEGGPSWGVVFGYDVSKNFAIELQYMQFANANIHLNQNSSYLDQNGNSIMDMVSKTDAYSLSGKFFAQVGDTHLRAFAAVGAGLVQRHDPLVGYNVNAQIVNGNGDLVDPNYTGKDASVSCVTPYLSSGLTYSFTRHWMLESGFQYYTGFGKSQVNPVVSFIPFAWDAYGRLAYQL